MIELPPGVREYVLAFADDEHVVGARHTSWIGLGPFLEEDLAFCSIAQDELGHAIALYELLADDVDALALLRAPANYRSAWLTEWPCRQWDEALARHVLYDHAEAVRWDALATSSVGELRAIAARAQREEAFHLAHGDALVGRVLDAGGDAARRLLAATGELLPLAVALFEPVEGETEALVDGVTTVPSADLADAWWSGVAALYERHGEHLRRPAPIAGQDARRARSPHFTELHAEIRRVIDLDPSARW